MESLANSYRHGGNGTDLEDTPIGDDAFRQDSSADNGALTTQECVKWGILWGGFVLTTLFAVWQRIRASNVSSDLHQEEGRPASFSSGTATRRTFYNLLLTALAFRTCMFPLLIYSYHHHEISRSFQLLADTLPLVAFTATWTWLVTFFVNLVATASGSTRSTSPSMYSEADTLSLNAALQWVAYGVCLCLISSYHWYHEAAAVLLYALLCCVYCTLLATWVYVCPKLLVLLQPLEYDVQLAARLWISCGGVFVVLLGETIALARQVLLFFPFSRRRLWFLYGFLELFPGLTLLLLMQTHKEDTNEGVASSGSGTLPQHHGGGGKNGTIQRSLSGSSGGGKHPNNKMAPNSSGSFSSETAPLLFKSNRRGSA